MDPAVSNLWIAFVGPALVFAVAVIDAAWRAVRAGAHRRIGRTLGPMLRGRVLVRSVVLLGLLGAVGAVAWPRLALMVPETPAEDTWTTAAHEHDHPGGCAAPIFTRCQNDAVCVGRAITLHYCGGCHDGDWFPLEGVAGTWRPMADGTYVFADEDYIRRALRRPREEVLLGGENIPMPPYRFDAVVEDAVIAYMLETGDWPMCEMPRQCEMPETVGPRVASMPAASGVPEPPR